MSGMATRERVAIHCLERIFGANSGLGLLKVVIDRKS